MEMNASMNNLIKEYNERIEQETGVDNEVLSTIWATFQNEMEEDEYEYDDDVALREQDLAMRRYTRREQPDESEPQDYENAVCKEWLEHLSFC